MRVKLLQQQLKEQQATEDAGISEFSLSLSLSLSLFLSFLLGVNKTIYLCV